MQLKATIRDGYIPVTLLKWKRLSIACVSENVEGLGENVEESYIPEEDVKGHNPFEKPLTIS